MIEGGILTGASIRLRRPFRPLLRLACWYAQFESAEQDGAGRMTAPEQCLNAWEAPTH